ncbi:MAG: DUF1707 domain-containing protein [Gemmatimonadota bacterium]|jgi:hypothetical protein
MVEGSSGDRAPLSQSRQVTIDALCEHFANDAMSVEEFERRVDEAHKAATVNELNELLMDLPGTNLPAAPGGAPARKAESAAADQVFRPTRYQVSTNPHQKEREFVVAILGGANRRGKWSPARFNYSVAFMGGTHFDFREAVLPRGVTELRVFTMMGGVEIIVPPGMNVESHGIGIMGGFEHLTDVATDDPEAPTLRITGVAFMGGVDIQQRYPGETARDAKRRRRAERKERRRLRRGE